MHVSNSHLNLLTLVDNTADELAKSRRYFFTKANAKHSNDAQWLLLANNKTALDAGLFKVFATQYQKDYAMDNDKKAIIWTDEHSDLFSILK